MTQHATTADAPPSRSLDDLYERLLVIEGYVRGRGEDLLTPNAVFAQYGIDRHRLGDAVERRLLKAYDKGRTPRGGGASYRVRRADVIGAFDLPPLTEVEPEPTAATAPEVEPVQPAKRIRRARGGK